MATEPVTERRAIKGFFSHWQFYLVLLGFIAACFRFYFQVGDIAEAQKKWQEGSEARRERTHESLDALDNRIIRLEKDIEWIKGRKQ